MEYSRDWDLPLDRGISYAVKVLRDSGVETFESCEGGDGHAFLEPTVRFNGGKAAGFHAVACAMNHGLPVADLRRFWMMVDGELDGPYWEMTFRPRERLLVLQQSAEADGLIT